MRPREMGGVVDPKLNVYGVENLKVAGTCFTLSSGTGLCLILLC